MSTLLFLLARFSVEAAIYSSVTMLCSVHVVMAISSVFTGRKVFE